MNILYAADRSSGGCFSHAVARYAWPVRHAGHVQDRYAGDLGDYLKFGLLRWLDARTRFFDDLLDFADLPVTARGARLERRRSWAQRALAATSGCDLIFADPDNGIRPVSHRVPAHRTKAAKHAYLSELAAFAARGQSLIVYHHAERVRVLG